MLVTPEPEQALARLAEGRSLCLATRLVADLETPVSAYLKVAALQPGRPSFLLESVEGGAVRGRYSIIGLAPDLVWRCEGGTVAVSAGDEAFGPEPAPLPALESLRRLVAASRIDELAGLPPMASGLFGYLGYDMVRLMERLPDAHPDPIGLPDALLMRPELVLVFDAVRDEIIVVTPLRPRPGISPRALHERGLERLEAAVAALERPLVQESASLADLEARSHPPVSNLPPAEYMARVQKAKEYILAGDIFQVVLSQRFSAPFDLPALSLYRALRRVNPSPYLCFLDFAAFQIVCSSPEILVRLRDDRVTIRPIAGTRRRGATPGEDAALAAELLADPKERAEHLMLLDLGRNDVGRVAAIGSVEVTDSFFIERYSQVMHIVSNVEGRLAAGEDALSALAAGFPAGTVSGAPKIRAMEIIDELERDKRGPYAGCIGYFGADGTMDTCIVLRTAVLKDGVMHVQAGAGIVADSDPKFEQLECEAKASALFRAAEEAVRFAARGSRGQ